MDVKAKGWYAEIIINHLPTVETQGSIFEILSHFSALLRDANPRGAKDSRTITLRIQETPFTAETISFAKQNAKMDRELGLQPGDVLGGPEPHETYDDFKTRLLGHMAEEQATWTANEWFDLPQDPIQVAWRNDPKVKQFNMINASSSGFARALPGEYIELKRYIIKTYPQFADRIKWRLANM